MILAKTMSSRDSQENNFWVLICCIILSKNSKNGNFQLSDFWKKRTIPKKSLQLNHFYQLSVLPIAFWINIFNEVTIFQYWKNEWSETFYVSCTIYFHEIKFDPSIWKQMSIYSMLLKNIPKNVSLNWKHSIMKKQSYFHDILQICYYSHL